MDQPLISVGMCILGGKLSVDRAFVTAVGEDAGLFPYVDFVVQF